MQQEWLEKYRTQIFELLEENRYTKVRDLLIEINDIDMAEMLELIAKELDIETSLLIFRMLPKEIEADVFSEFTNDYQQKLIETISDKEISRIINELYLDEVIDFIEEMPANLVNRILRNASTTKRKQINKILNYPEDSAGSLMTTEFLEIKKDMTVKETLEYIKKVSEDKVTINTCYVTDNKGRFEGTVSIRKIIISEEDTKIGDIMKTTNVYVYTLQDQEEVTQLFKKYDVNVMPVLDKQNMLVGIITVDDTIEVIDEETTEDIEKMAALAPSENEYLKTSVFELAKNRIFWLVILTIVSILSATVIRNYEELLSNMAILSAYIPILMGTGGNAGSQSSVLIIRGMSLGEIKLNDIFKIILKEFCVGLILGTILSILNFIKVGVIGTTGIKIGLVVSLSLIIVVVVANVLGGILPIVAKKMKFDPAIMASPLVTTIMDITSLIIYFSIAKLILM